MIIITTKRSIQACSLIEKMNRNPQHAKGLGIVNQSRFNANKLSAPGEITGVKILLS